MHCQQDVPAAPRVAEGRLGCGRCGRPFDGPDSEAARPEGPQSAADKPSGQSGQTPEPADDALAYDAWEMDERLRQIERLLAIYRIDEGSWGELREPNRRRKRVDARHPGAGGPHRRPRRRRPRSAGRKLPRGTWSSAASWVFLAFGLMGLACGGVILGWSLLVGRSQLWSAGVSVAVAGQLLLLISFVLQIDRLWANHRHTAEKLDQVDHELEQLSKLAPHRPAGRLGGTAGSADPPASGVAEIFLADIKNRLDLLATKLDRQRKSA